MVSVTAWKVTRSLNGMVICCPAGERTAPKVKMIPSMADMRRAFTCESILGMKMIPQIYPMIIPSMVSEVKYFADDMSICNDCPYRIMVSPAMTSTPT